MQMRYRSSSILSTERISHAGVRFGSLPVVEKQLRPHDASAMAAASRVVTLARSALPVLRAVPAATVNPNVCAEPFASALLSGPGAAMRWSMQPAVSPLTSAPGLGECFQPLQALNRNARKPKKANHGKRPNSHFGRRKKRLRRS